MNTDPNSVYRKNLIAAYSRFADPQIPIRKYIGTSTSSQKMKNRIRSNAMNVPAMPVSSSNWSARNPFVRPGLGRNVAIVIAQSSQPLFMSPLLLEDADGDDGEHHAREHERGVSLHVARL